MSTKVKWNDPGAQAILDGAQGVRPMLHARAQRALAAAKADSHDDTYDYENGLRVVEDHTDRLVVRVASGDWKGHILEAKYGILARALDAAGGD